MSEKTEEQLSGTKDEQDEDCDVCLPTFENPPCPKCGKKTVICFSDHRVTVEMKKIVKVFFGCGDFPKCTGQIDLDGRYVVDGDSDAEKSIREGDRVSK